MKNKIKLCAENFTLNGNKIKHTNLFVYYFKQINLMSHSMNTLP